MNEAWIQASSQQICVNVTNGKFNGGQVMILEESDEGKFIDEEHKKSNNS